MPTIPVYVVDAFTRRPFSGNPAAVCPLEAWLPDAQMQQIAAEHNLAETAFIVNEPAGWRIRWFTPAVEVDLCGHATLASAHVLAHHLGYLTGEVIFNSRSGPLPVRFEGDGQIVLDFPSRPGTRCEVPAALREGLGANPAEVLRSRDFLVVFDDEETVRALTPDFAALARLDCLGVIVTAPGREVDFVSRFFAPRVGVNEDPVTGSAHCTLTPYWSARLRKAELRARQVSARGGDLVCRLAGDRVHIAGHAVTYLTGSAQLGCDSV
jgi:PhzF family phenazine biosynthesis protein